MVCLIMRLYSLTLDRIKRRYPTVKTAQRLRYFHRLGHSIYLDEHGKTNAPGPDASKWKQCWTCGVIVGVYGRNKRLIL